MESRKFEDEFKNAFDGAEMSPSDNVWTNIELDLEKSEGGKMKRRLLFFQLLTAASVAFAMGMAGVGYFLLQDYHYENMLGNSRMAQQTETTTSANTSASNGSATGTTATITTGTETTVPETATSSSVAENASSPIAAADETATSSVNGSASKAGNTIAAQNKIKATSADPNGSAPASVEPNVSTLPANVQAAGAKSDKASRDKTASDKSTTNSYADATTKSSNTNSAEKKSAQQNASMLADASVQNSVNRNATTANNKNNGAQKSSDVNKLADGSSTSTTVAKADNTTSTSTQKNTDGESGSLVMKATTDQQAIAQTEIRNNTLFNSGHYASSSQAYDRLAKNVSKVPSRVDKPASDTPQVDPVAQMMARLAQREQEIAEEAEKDEKKKEMTGEKLWTSVGFAAGSFNSVNSSVSSSLAASSFAANNVANQQAKANGSAYSVGVSMGTKLSNRWVLQGGINYMTQNSDYTANAANTSDFASFKAPSVNTMMSADAETFNRSVPVTPYSVNNNVRFMSVPLQAGYLVMNRKFGIQLNGGVSTDLFLQNTITPESGDMSKTTQGSGADSPYRTVNFSGLVGTELSYKVGTHYRVAVNPGLRYPFNSIYKSDQPIAATPLTFDVGLKFRYIFH